MTVFSDTVKPQVGEIWNVREDTYILILDRIGNNVKYVLLTGYSFGKIHIDFIKNFIGCERLD